MQRAITSKSEGIAQGNAVLQANGWPTDNVTFLRSIPAADFSSKMLSANNGGWSASLDDLVLSESAHSLYADPSVKLNAESIIAGFNSMDGIYAEPFGMGSAPKTDQEYKSLIEEFVQNETLQHRLHSHYYPPSDFAPYSFGPSVSYSSYEMAWWTMNSDVCVLCPTLKLAEQLSSNEAEPAVFVYDFKGPRHNNSYRAHHVSEIPFVFHLEAAGEESLRIPWDQQLSDSMLSSWVNMGIDGIPDITNRIDDVDLEWTPFDAVEGNVMLFQTEEGGLTNRLDFKLKYRDNVCDFWYNEAGEATMYNVCWERNGETAS